MHVIDIGHTAIMVPVACAISAWLVLHRAWMLAWWWCAIFATGLAVVAGSKIAFLGWGFELAPLGFQALSGHAWRTSAVLPVLSFLVLRRQSAAWRTGGLALALAGSLGLGALLVAFGLHTVSEVVASLALGAAAAAAFIARARRAPLRRATGRALAGSLAAGVAIAALQPASVTPRLVDVALYLSGRDHPYRWASARHDRPSPSEVHITECRLHVPPHTRRE